MNCLYLFFIAMVAFCAVFCTIIFWAFLPKEKYRKRDFNKEILLTIVMILVLILCCFDFKNEMLNITASRFQPQKDTFSHKSQSSESDNNYLYNIINDIQFESPIIESSTNITKMLESDFEKNKVESKNITLKINNKNKTNYSYLIISKKIPNLYRASVLSNKKIEYLISRNKLKNESDVYIGQKIYY